ncbi:ArsR family transcriptional regulator, partial [Streptomyces sp. HSW2009]
MQYVANMLPKARHEKLLSLLGAEGVLPIREIARRLAVSEARGGGGGAARRRAPRRGRGGGGARGGP